MLVYQRVMIWSTLGCPIFQYDEKYHPFRWDVMLPLGKLTVFRYPGLVNIQKAIENGPFIVDYPLKIVIFHSYVSLPEDKQIQTDC
jgi:hypothetical protein